MTRTAPFDSCSTGRSSEYHRHMHIRQMSHDDCGGIPHVSSFSSRLLDPSPIVCFPFFELFCLIIPLPPVRPAIVLPGMPPEVPRLLSSSYQNAGSSKIRRHSDLPLQAALYLTKVQCQFEGSEHKGPIQRILQFTSRRELEIPTPAIYCITIIAFSDDDLQSNHL